MKEITEKHELSRDRILRNKKLSEAKKNTERFNLWVNYIADSVTFSQKLDYV